MLYKLRIKYFFILISILLFSLFAVLFYVCNIWFNFDLDSYSTEFKHSFKQYIHLDEENKIYIDSEGLLILKESEIELQVLDNENKEVFNYNKPETAKTKYSTTDLINAYNNYEYTLFIDDTSLNNNTYTYLLFFNTNNVKRVMFTYDKTQLIESHNLPFFVAIMIIFFILIGCIYLIHISKPINEIIDRITSLSKGNYTNQKASKGIYSDVSNSLNLLSTMLYTNELEREKLDNMRKEWTANISHDIKTPLTSIRGNAEIMSLNGNYVSSDSRISYSNIIINKADYIKNLVDDLNLSSRLKDNNFIPNKKQVNIISLLRHVIIDISNDEKYSKGNLSFNLYEEEILKELDENLMKRVFMNLIVNAFVHNNYDVDIKVTVCKVTLNKVKIIIEDNGIGINENDLKHIFKRYFRGTKTSQVTEGSGLGMAIAHDIVQVHNGNILVESTENLGTKVTIII